MDSATECPDERRRRLNREKTARYRTRHPDRVKESRRISNAKQWARPEVRDESIARLTQYFSKHPERNRAAVAKYKLANPEVKANRRGKGRLSKGLVERLFLLQRSRCAVCHKDLLKVGHHLDHIIPLARGGLNEDGNMQLLCPRCNLTKNAKDPVEFMQSRGFLL